MAKDRGLNQEIIEKIKLRLEKGRSTYNKEVTLNDPRDYLQEAIEEALDLSVYLSAQLIRMQELNNGKNL